ncbi:hypothetical protein ANN_04668 [Periplaneta americana]|uniref:Uncharacterized protein n=1 Tax=Periplaneta americana TaxID=6978 RepID=A0ABQ8T9T8_PERAM|nr:hypothetical protein ANN_04668 [Periplaneta americana]
MTPLEIKVDMDVTLGESGPAFSTVKKRVAQFKHGRENVEDDPAVDVQQQQQGLMHHEFIPEGRTVTKELCRNPPSPLGRSEKETSRKVGRKQLVPYA